MFLFSSDEEELSNLKSMLDCDEGEGVHYQPPKTKDEILPQVCLIIIDFTSIS